MTFLTGLALRRRSVTMLIILLILVGGIVTYQRFERELFPEIEFPNIIIITYYAFANPDAVVRDVTEPIEDAIDGVSGLKEFQSVSTENTSMITATFEFGEDMVEAERSIISNINALQFPDGVTEPYVSRIASDTFPVLQLSVLGDRDIPSLQRILDDLIVPRIEVVDGVAYVTVLGWSEEQVFVTVDVDKVQDVGLSLSAVAGAIQANNLSSPAGNIDDGGRNIPVRIDHELGSLDEIKDLVVGFETISSNRQGQRPVRLSDIAVVELDTEKANRISRANGSPSLGVIVLKDPDANTLDVTEGVLAGLDGIEGLPTDVEIFVLTNDGPEIRAQLGALLREGFWGLVFAVATVFAFLLNLRPTILRGVTLALRPTLIIGISIPLSIITGILLMGFIGLPLNFMTLAGLAIAVGRVVDDSIVVLENMYRHIQAGEDRMQAALDGTREVAAAIVASTLTTVVIFVPLAFIQGLVGSFFSPFAIAVSFALIASTFVALTAVPVLGSVLLRPGDLPDDGAGGGSQGGGGYPHTAAVYPGVALVLGAQAGHGAYRRAHRGCQPESPFGNSYNLFSGGRSPVPDHRCGAAHRNVNCAYLRGCPASGGRFSRPERPRPSKKLPSGHWGRVRSVRQRNHWQRSQYGGLRCGFGRRRTLGHCGYNS